MSSKFESNEMKCGWFFQVEDCRDHAMPSLMRSGCEQERKVLIKQRSGCDQERKVLIKQSLCKTFGHHLTLKRVDSCSSDFRTTGCYKTSIFLVSELQ